MNFWNGSRKYITPIELGALIQGEKIRMGGLVLQKVNEFPSVVHAIKKVERDERDFLPSVRGWSISEVEDEAEPLPDEIGYQPSTIFNITKEWDETFKLITQRKEKYGILIKTPTGEGLHYTAMEYRSAATAIHLYCERNGMNVLDSNSPGGKEKGIATGLRTRQRKGDHQTIGDVEWILDAWGRKQLEFTHKEIHLKSRVSEMVVYMVYDNTPHYTAK